MSDDLVAWLRSRRPGLLAEYITYAAAVRREAEIAGDRQRQPVSLEDFLLGVEPDLVHKWRGRRVEVVQS